MRSFRDHKAFHAYKHPQKEKLLKYIEFMYGIGSDLNKIDNIEERQTTAATRAGLKIDEGVQTIFQEKDVAFQDLRHAFLSEYQFHNKYQNLITWQIMLWKVQRDVMELLAGVDFKKYSDGVDLMEKLEGKIHRTFSEIYGDNKIIEVAKENIRKSKSVEEKLLEGQTNGKSI